MLNFVLLLLADGPLVVEGGGVEFIGEVEMGRVEVLGVGVVLNGEEFLLMNLKNAVAFPLAVGLEVLLSFPLVHNYNWNSNRN